ncbi:esterase FE4-like isoform X2 [Nomia melanderi]|uniref:esterase FE4-like isoform X2 n=1 Tax=Nomia melanderi TaxID=2448451 RepID=UPI0013040BAA|nr:esterase FE4-like isoform X2 [Nomia melanderi]XP_031826308.1 esterase FE4-like isoform X2 [Nomia melanderi]
MILVRKQFALYAQSFCKVRWSVASLVRVGSTMYNPIVIVKQGKLRGAVEKSVLGTSFIAFHEIPFAAPPIGELRFKDPQPPAPWTDVKDVSKPVGKRSLQLQELNPQNVIGTEDCLYLNVYTASLDQCKPVMFWIHGGGYLSGTGSFEEKRPDYLLTKDVVVVSVNYRLGAFGFLNLGHKAAPGNQGLKDLIAALEWVKENISNFGGDPNNVTAFGASAGGVLTHALAVSPRAKGLIHKAIMQSGLLSCPWNAGQSRPERGFKLANALGTDSTDPEEVVRYLRTVDAADIVNATKNILTKEEDSIFSLPFSLNTDDVADNPVLPLPMEQMMEKDICIPVIVGYTSHEFIMFLKDNSDKTMMHFNSILPQYVKLLAKLKKLEPEKIEMLLETVRDRYLDKEPISAQNLEKFSDFITDLYFGIPVKMYLEDRVKRTSTPSYCYVYSYVGTQKTHTDILVNRVIKGASHVDELAYLFYLKSIKVDDPEPPAIGTKDRLTIERLTSLWTNFGRTGNPTPCLDENIKVLWEPATEDQFKYLDIGEELQLLCIEPHIFNCS